MDQEKSHNNDAIEIGIGDDKKEIFELKVRLDLLPELLQRQRHGWVINRTIKWPIKQFMERILKLKLKGLEVGKLKINIYICEREKRSLLGDNDDEMNVDSVPTNGTINYCEEQSLKTIVYIDKRPEQREDDKCMDMDVNKKIEEDEEDLVDNLKDCMHESIRETSRSHDFENNTYFVFSCNGESQETENKLKIKKAHEPLEEPMKVYKGIDMGLLLQKQFFQRIGWTIQRTIIK